jgi:hypothetical protein
VDIAPIRVDRPFGTASICEVKAVAKNSKQKTSATDSERAAVMNDQSEMLLDILQLYAEHNFEGITTGDESWFLYTTYGDSMFTASAREVVPRTRQNIYAMKTMVTIFFTSTRLLVLNFLPKGTKFNQDYFADTVLPNLSSEKRRIARRKYLPSFSVRMDNSMCHKGAKITEKLEKRHIARAPHPLS